jgi:hypothetical protein
MVLVVTPAALRSKTCRDEWRYARQRGVCVYSVMGVPETDIDFVSVPRWMRDTHWYNLPGYEEQWTKLLRTTLDAPSSSERRFVIRVNPTPKLPWFTSPFSTREW